MLYRSDQQRAVVIVVEGDTFTPENSVFTLAGVLE